MTEVTTEEAPARQGLMGTGRVEAFSDGVFAVAITLLVLDLHVPDEPGAGHLAHGLVSSGMLASYAAYAVSFLVLGIIWLNHHSLFRQLAGADRIMLLLNLVLLMVSTAIPFATSVLARYLHSGGSDAHAAAFLYSLLMFGMALTYSVMWVWATSRDCHLLPTRMTPAAVRTSRLRFGIGSIVYVFLLGLAFVSAPLTLAMHGALALYYALGEQLQT